MYLTSVGVPSTVYETVRSLRQARAQRLGAIQRKLPTVHMILLWILAAIELVSFPLLGAGTQSIGGYNILTVEGCLFGVMTFGIVLTMRVSALEEQSKFVGSLFIFSDRYCSISLLILKVVGELWRPAGGAYNVDNVLKTMVKGLEDELKARMDGKKINTMKGVYPSPAKVIDAEYLERASAKITQNNKKDDS